MRTDLRTELVDAVGQYRDLATALEQFAEVRACARARDASVTATVDGRGELLELVIDPARAARLDLSELAARIVEAVGRAAAEARGRTAATALAFLPPSLRDLVGADGGV